MSKMPATKLAHTTCTVKRSTWGGDTPQATKKLQEGIKSNSNSDYFLFGAALPSAPDDENAAEARMITAAKSSRCSGTSFKNTAS